MAGLIAIVAIVVVAMFAGCVEKEPSVKTSEISPSPMPEQTRTTTPTPASTSTPLPEPEERHPVTAEVTISGELVGLWQPMLAPPEFVLWEDTFRRLAIKDDSGNVIALFSPVAKGEKELIADRQYDKDGLVRIVAHLADHTYTVKPLFRTGKEKIERLPHTDCKITYIGKRVTVTGINRGTQKTLCGGLDATTVETIEELSVRR